MAVAFDAIPTGAPASDVVFGAVSTINLTTLTVGSGTNRALVAGIIISSTSAPTSVTAVWDSGGTNQSMTQIGTGTSTTTSTMQYIFLFGLLAPTSGNKTLAFSWTNAASNGGYASAISFTGVNQTSVAAAFINFNTNNLSANPSTITITTTSGNATVEFGGDFSGAPSATNQTLWYEDTAGGPNGWAAYALSVGASTAYSTTTGTPTFGVETGCDIVAFVAGGGPGVLIAHG